MSPVTVSEALHRSGVIIERARREGRSLSKTERCIILAGRGLAGERRLTKERLNAAEMEGERDWDRVLIPIKVVAVFSYYDDPAFEFPARPNYLIRQSNHPGLGGHVGLDELSEAGQKVPPTPTFEKWVKAGRKVVRS